MNALQAVFMGLLQGLTEFLPVSSSGHLAAAGAFFGIDGEASLAFTVAVHVATVLATLVVLWKEVAWIVRGVFRREGGLNAERRYALAILVSMIPVGIVGVFFKDAVEQVFGSGLLVVGCCLLVTAALLAFTHFAKARKKETISYGDAFAIGVAQAVAVLPGISRSGSTIATGLLLGNKKDALAQFSFLMVIPPILGEALLDVAKALHGGGAEAAGAGGIGMLPLTAGFVTAFITGCLACRWMIGIVRKGKLAWFSVYCALLGAVLIGCALAGVA
jgi:undecaprenyl-diphosphatase